MAGIWFKPENTLGRLLSPIIYSNDDHGFYGTKNVYFYALLQLNSSQLDQLLYLATILWGYDSSISTITGRTHIYIENGTLKFYNNVNGTGRASASLPTPIPTDEPVELVVTATHGRNDYSSNILVYVNGVLQNDTQSVNRYMSVFGTYSQVILGGSHQQLSAAKDLLLLDVAIVNDWIDSVAPPGGSTSTYRTVWRSDFEDSENPLKIITSRNGIETEQNWTNTDTEERVIWVEGNSPPSTGSGGAGGIIIPGNGNTTRIQGTVKEEDQVVSRRVFAITQALLEVAGSNERKHAVLNSVTSDENNGSYSLDTSLYEDAVLVVAVDDFGQAWQSNTAYVVGDVIRPPTFQGYVYTCSQAGTSDRTEPGWWFDTEESHTIGTAQFKAKPYNRPLAHGPLIPEIVSES